MTVDATRGLPPAFDPILVQHPLDRQAIASLKRVRGFFEMVQQVITLCSIALSKQEEIVFVRFHTKGLKAIPHVKEISHCLHRFAP